MEFLHWEKKEETADSPRYLPLSANVTKDLHKGHGKGRKASEGPLRAKKKKEPGVDAAKGISKNLPVLANNGRVERPDVNTHYKTHASLLMRGRRRDE